MKYKTSIQTFRSLFAQVTELHYKCTLLKALLNRPRNRTDQQNKIVILEKDTNISKKLIVEMKCATENIFETVLFSKLFGGKWLIIWNKLKSTLFSTL